jgi:hypothetical protein
VAIYRDLQVGSSEPIDIASGKKSLPRQSVDREVKLTFRSNAGTRKEVILPKWWLPEWIRDGVNGASTSDEGITWRIKIPLKDGTTNGAQFDVRLSNGHRLPGQKDWPR